MRLTSVVNKLKPSATLAINETITRRREKGDQILHMGFGESPFPVHPRIQQALCDHADEKRYLPTQGLPALCQQIASFYKNMFDLDYSADQIMVGPGSKTLLYGSLVALDGPLYLPAPSWVSYQHQAHLLEKEVHHIPTRPENSYRLTPQALQAALQQHNPNPEQQKILLLNYPCNPTGHSFSGPQLAELAEVARESNVIILSDEIYGLISYSNQNHQSIAKFYPEGTLVTGGLSKDRSLGGFRVGVMLLPKAETALLRALLSLASETWSCVSAPIQYAAIEAYTPSPDLIKYIQDCTTIHEQVTTYVHHQLINYRIRCPPPQGAFYLFPDWNQYKSALTKHKITTSPELAHHLLSKWNVASLPGAEFGMPADNLCLRLATVDYNGSSAYDYYLKKHLQTNFDEGFVNTVAPQIVKACRQLGEFTKSLQK